MIYNLKIMEYLTKIKLEIKKTLNFYNFFVNSYKFSLALSSLDKVKKLISEAKYNNIDIPKKIIFLLYKLEKNITTNDFYMNLSNSKNKNYPYKIANPYIIIKKFIKS